MIDTRKLNYLRSIAIQKNIISSGERSYDCLPVEQYWALYNAFLYSTRKNGTQKVNKEVAERIAHAVLCNTELTCITYICVSDYVGGTRYQMQAGTYALTTGERNMFQTVHHIQSVCDIYTVPFRWILILADGWGEFLYGDRVIDGALKQYNNFMVSECSKRNLECLKWSTVMTEFKQTYTSAVNEVSTTAQQLAPWEAQHGEIAHDKPDAEKLHQYAHDHICMRAAEGVVMHKMLGPIIVLSTEGPKLTKYDNLLIQKEQYAHHHTMPFWPHRI